MASETVSLDRNGRLFIPAGIRKAMGWKLGDILTLNPSRNELQVLSRRQAIEQIRAEVLRHIRPGVSLADGLIRERREEVRREDEEYKRSVERRKRRVSGRARKSRGPVKGSRG